MGLLRAGINFKLKSRTASGSIVFIHGLFMPSAIMLPLAGRMNRDGFHCYGYDYPTCRKRIPEHGRELAETLARFPVAKFHLVTHSMGGLILRSALELAPELTERLSRVVMIAPPNRGSDLALKWLNRLSFAHKLVTPLPDLSSGKESPVHTLHIPSGVEIGILAAENDHAVNIEQTHLGVEQAHCILPGRHTNILFREDTAEAVEKFLRTGKFSV